VSERLFTLLLVAMLGFGVGFAVVALVRLLA